MLIKYEERSVLNQYLLLHYGNYDETMAYPMLPHNTVEFPKRCAQLIFEMAIKNNVSLNKAIDLGCAVGGASFELARNFSQVTGVDSSKAFILAANQIKKSGIVLVERQEEAKIITPLKFEIDKETDRNRITFQIADACALPDTFCDYDAVLIANLLCRLPDPKSFLLRMSGQYGVVKQGGLMLITSPYSWLENFTSEEAWLGEEQRSSFKILSTILDKNFKLLYETNMPLVIREHARKYEYIIAHATMWQRTS